MFLAAKASLFFFCRVVNPGRLPFICLESRFLFEMTMDSVLGVMFTNILQFLVELMALYTGVNFRGENDFLRHGIIFASLT